MYPQPKTLSFASATHNQLCAIAYHDNEAPLSIRISAAEELKRRNRITPKKQTQFKRKAVYPR